MVRKRNQIWYTDKMTWHKIHNWFLPHKDTHKKAHLISWEALLFYILLFILMQVGFSIVGYTKPGILGISSNVDHKKIVEFTNVERAKKGLPPVLENEALDKAAALKAQNMFAENYWAHFAPSGKTPWDFILGSGYKFIYAGENLAKNFYESDDVVDAWMASPTHRDNLLNSKYRDIGIAVAEGQLDGQNTVLIVQMFGSVQGIASNPSVNTEGKEILVPIDDYQNAREIIGSVQSKAKTASFIDSYAFSKTSGLILISFISVLLTLDFIVIYKRGVFRITSHHIAHLSLLGISAATIFYSSPGAIL